MHTGQTTQDIQTAEAVDSHAESSGVSTSWLVASLVGLALATYWPVRSYDFVNWDDPWYVINNPYLTSWHPSNLRDIATHVINRNYSPIIIFTLLIERTIFGLDASGYHIVNVLFHALNAALVFVLIARLTNSRTIGWGTAALFAVHPVQIESVAWISSIKGLVCATFILAHLICWMRPQRSARQDLWGLIFFFFALMSKALTVVVPAIVLLYDVFACRKKFSEALSRQFIPGVLSLWMLLTTMGAQVTSLGGLRGHMELSKPQIIAVDSVILWKYVGVQFWPSNLSLLYDQPTSGITGQIVLASIAWLLTGVIVWRLRKRLPLVFVACCSWLLLLLPVLNLTPITTLMNDRYLYMPLIPFFACVLCGLRSLINLRPQISRQTACQLIPVGIAVAGFLITTRAHLPVWQNDRTLWEHTVHQSPNLPLVQIQYAMMLHQRGDNMQAVEVLQRTLTQLAPDSLDEERIREKIDDWTTAPKAKLPQTAT